MSSSSCRLAGLLLGLWDMTTVVLWAIEDFDVQAIAGQKDNPIVAQVRFCEASSELFSQAHDLRRIVP